MLDRRLNMVNGQLRTGGVVDKALLAAFLDTPRQRFVKPECAELAYLDRQLPARAMPEAGTAMARRPSPPWARRSCCWNPTPARRRRRRPSFTAGRASPCP